VAEVVVVFHALKVCEGKARFAGTHLESAAPVADEEASEGIKGMLGGIRVRDGGAGRKSGQWGGADGGAQEGVNFGGEGNAAGAGAGGSDLVKVGIEGDGEAHGGAVV